MRALLKQRHRYCRNQGRCCERHCCWNVDIQMKLWFKWANQNKTDATTAKVGHRGCGTTATTKQGWHMADHHLDFCSGEKWTTCLCQRATCGYCSALMAPLGSCASCPASAAVGPPPPSK